MWKEVAVELGYTHEDIRRFSNQPEPIFAIIKDFISKGGIEEDFLNTMYKIASYFNTDTHHGNLLSDFHNIKKMQQHGREMSPFLLPVVIDSPSF